MTDTMPTTDPMSADNRSMIGRDEIDDLESILAVTNTDRDEVVHHVQNHAETIYTWNYDKGERPALNKLYEKAKNAQWNGETDLPWETEVDPEKVVAENADRQRRRRLHPGSDAGARRPLHQLSDADLGASPSSPTSGPCRSSSTASRAPWCAPPRSSRPCRGSTPSTTPPRR
jgi:hypothetical protein